MALRSVLGATKGVGLGLVTGAGLYIGLNKQMWSVVHSTAALAQDCESRLLGAVNYTATLTDKNPFSPPDEPALSPADMEDPRKLKWNSVVQTVPQLLLRSDLDDVVAAKFTELQAMVPDIPAAVPAPAPLEPPTASAFANETTVVATPGEQKFE